MVKIYSKGKKDNAIKILITDGNVKKYKTIPIEVYNELKQQLNKFSSIDDVLKFIEERTQQQHKKTKKKTIKEEKTIEKSEEKNKEEKSIKETTETPKEDETKDIEKEILMNEFTFIGDYENLTLFLFLPKNIIEKFIETGNIEKLNRYKKFVLDVARKKNIIKNKNISIAPFYIRTQFREYKSLSNIKVNNNRVVILDGIGQSLYILDNLKKETNNEKIVINNGHYIKYITKYKGYKFIIHLNDTYVGFNIDRLSEFINSNPEFIDFEILLNYYKLKPDINDFLDIKYNFDEVKIISNMNFRNPYKLFVDLNISLEKNDFEIVITPYVSSKDSIILHINIPKKYFIDKIMSVFPFPPINIYTEVYNRCISSEWTGSKKCNIITYIKVFPKITLNGSSSPYTEFVIKTNNYRFDIFELKNTKTTLFSLLSDEKGIKGDIPIYIGKKEITIMLNKDNIIAFIDNFISFVRNKIIEELNK